MLFHADDEFPQQQQKKGEFPSQFVDEEIIREFIIYSFCSSGKNDFNFGK
jgi:hypothetical protein